MKNKIALKFIMGLFVVGFLFIGCSDDDSIVIPDATSNALVNLPFFVETENSEIPSEASQLLFETRNHAPVLAPDGHQLTWGEYASVKGNIEVTCTNEGVETTLNLTGLIPNGVYTIWNVTFEAPGFDPAETMFGIDGLGAAGRGDGSDNIFTATSTGTGEITLVSPGQNLSLFGEMGNCPLTDNFEWHIVGTYHIDGKTYGPVIGPDGTFTEQFGFIFREEG